MKIQTFASGLVAAGLAFGLAACGSSTPSSSPTTAHVKQVDAKVAADIQRVDAEVQTVQIALGEVIKSSTQQNIDQLAQMADTAHSQLADAKTAIAVDAGSGSTGVALFTAVNELKNSMGALTAFAGTPNATTLASFTNQYQPGVNDWNAAVSAIYAGVPGAAPTIATS